MPIIGAVAEVADQDILVTAAERYSVLRRFSPRFLAAFRFDSNVPHDQVLAAIEVLKTMDRDGARTFPKRPPASFLPPKWRKLIFAAGMADRRLYETAVLAALRGRLRSSDIWVADSPDYRAYLLPAEAARNIGIDHETRVLYRHSRRDGSRVRSLLPVWVPIRAADQGPEGPQALHDREAWHVSTA